MTQFDKTAVKRWRRFVWGELHKAGFDDRAGYIGLVMVTVSEFGTAIETLAEITGCQPAFIRDVLTRMRRARILSGQTMRIGQWDKKGFHGEVALILDAMATAGDIRRVPNPKRVAAAHRRDVSKAPTSARTPRRKMSINPTAIFTPKRTKSDAWYASNETTDEDCR